MTDEREHFLEQVKSMMAKCPPGADFLFVSVFDTGPKPEDGSVLNFVTCGESTQTGSDLAGELAECLLDYLEEGSDIDQCGAESPNLTKTRH